MSDMPQLFDRARRRHLRARSAGQPSVFLQWMAEDLAERLSAVARDFSDILLIGPLARFQGALQLPAGAKVKVAALSEAESALDAVLCEEDRLPFDPGSFDLILSAGTLDSVNDLTGALIQIRRSLRPDGLFLGSMFGAGSLIRLKRCMIAADGPRTAAHIHPQIDVRSAGDLLARAGFAMPVADGDRLTLRYSDPMRLVRDIREAGTGNALAGPRAGLGKSGFTRLLESWAAVAEADGKVSERLELISLSGWAPAPSQAKPARRGSGTVSLAEALRPDDEKPR
ncbi:methyltransferase domain-containing protein [Novosphingopyxis sp.]|uniref:methyltransferase domain-containing protein n=1 Tax=Novosphingopyxis sp. TaxID=2709690 RepID=UPI003B59D8F9